MAAPIVSFTDIWAAFMCDRPVREWLFNRSPLSQSEAWECVTNKPEPLSFSFDPSSVQVTGAENLHDFAQLSTVLYHTRGVALGVTFGNGNKQPVLPMAKALNNDPEFEDNVAIVRRCAIRRISPRSRHLVRLQADWFRSGVLGFDFSFIPADNPDVHPSVGFAIFGYRMFKKSEAAALYQAAMYPSQSFIDGSTPLLKPADGYITLDACDSQFQTPCIFCASRNTVLCHCPAPLRRRVEREGASDGMIQALTTTTGESDSSAEAVKEMVWHYFAHRMKSSLSTGTFLTNWRYERPKVPGMSHVLVTHVIPYALLFNNTGAQTPIVQRAISALGLGSKRPQAFGASYNNNNTPRITAGNLGNGNGNGNGGGGHNINTYHHGSSYTTFHARNSDDDAAFYQQNVVQQALVADDNVVPYHKARQSSVDSIPTLDLVTNQSPPQHTYQQHIQNQIAASLFDHNVNLNNVLLPCSPKHPQNPTSAENSFFNASHVQNKNNPTNSPAPSHSHSMPVAMMEDLLIGAKISPDSEKTHMNMNMDNAPAAAAAAPLSVPNGTIPQPTNVAVNPNGAVNVNEVPVATVENGRRKRQRPVASKRGGVAKKETRTWQCDQCDAVIRGKRSNLTRHKQNKHAKVRAFSCENCPKRFQTRLNLVRHQRLVHEGRPFHCPSCPRQFKTEEKLKKHTDGVHAPGITPLACHHCGGCYGKRSTLSRHITSVHRTPSDVSDDININSNNNNNGNGNGGRGNQAAGNADNANVNGDRGAVSVSVSAASAGERGMGMAHGTQNGTTKKEENVVRPIDIEANTGQTQRQTTQIHKYSNLNPMHPTHPMNPTHPLNVINLHHEPMQLNAVPVPVPFLQRPPPQQQQTAREMVM